MSIIKKFNLGSNLSKVSMLLSGLILSFLIFNSPALQAKPSITWSPRSIEQTLVRGEADVVSVSFTPQSNLANAVVTVVPELQPFVAVTPTTFNALTKGTIYTIDITFFSESDSKKGAYDGTIHLTRGNSTVSRPFPVIINNGIPPDPGETGKTTLEGIDSDGDGVRDDIQRYIVLNYPDSKRMQEAFFYDAKNLQTMLLVADNEEKSIENHKKSISSLDCIVAVAEDEGELEPEVPVLMRRAMRAEFLNTQERLEVFLLHNNQLAGNGFSVPDLGIEACNFDVTELGD